MFPLSRTTIPVRRRLPDRRRLRNWLKPGKYPWRQPISTAIPSRTIKHLSTTAAQGLARIGSRWQRQTMDKPVIFYASDAARVDRDPARLAFLAQRGALVRIRHGAYLPAETWTSLNESEKYGLRAEALSRFTASAPVFCRQSAAMLWGLPLIRVPEKLHIVNASPGHGRSRRGIMAHYGPLCGRETSISEFRLTDKARTAVELCAQLPFAEALGVMDAALRAERDSFAAGWSEWARTSPRGPAVARPTLETLALALPTQAARRRVLKVLALASEYAESLGESISRAQLHLAGFPAPCLQQAFTLPDGRQVRSDFFWREFHLVGEFGGKEKYFRGDWANGQTPGERVYAEKLRER